MSGFSVVPGVVPRLTNFSSSIAAATTTAIVAAAAGLIVRVYRIFILPSAANTLTFQDSASGALQIPALTYTAVTNSAPSLFDFTGEPWLTMTKGLGLQLVTSTAAPTAVSVWWEATSS
jgi:hypothetical protein